MVVIESPSALRPHERDGVLRRHPAPDENRASHEGGTIDAATAVDQHALSCGYQASYEISHGDEEPDIRRRPVLDEPVNVERNLNERGIIAIQIDHRVPLFTRHWCPGYPQTVDDLGWRPGRNAPSGGICHCGTISNQRVAPLSLLS
jgi:hypothetical protein